MLLDLQSMFSDKQAITATAASTNVIDLQAVRDVSAGEPVGILIQVTEAFNNLTDLTIALESDDNSAFSSPTTVPGSSQTIVLANLGKGARHAMKYLPAITERFLRVKYTVNGTAPTAGKVTAVLVRRGDRQNWQAYNDAVTQLV